MSTNDELLVRLDNLIRTHEGKMIDCHDAAAAIRELEAKLDAERKISATRIVDLLKRATAAEAKLREVEAATIERCAKVCEKRAYERFGEFGTTEHDTGATYYEGKAGEIYESMDEEDDDCAKAIRAIASDQTALHEGCAPADIAVLRQANIDLAQESHIRATLLQEWLDTELDSQDEEYQPWLDDFTARVKAALPSEGNAPERTVLEQFQRLLEGPVDPASPLLPGLERDATLNELIAEIDRPLWRSAAYARLDELTAEISRLKGEGRGS